MSDSQKPDSCPCGGIMLADTEDWKIPLCHSCWHDIGEPSFEPKHDHTTLALAKRTEEMWKARANYDRLFQQALAMREALASLKEDSRHYFDLVGDSINLSNPYSQGRYDVFKWVDEQTTKALEQFDEFMKKSGEK